MKDAMSARLKRPTPILELLRQTIDRYHLAPALAKAEVFEEWPRIVGATLATRSRPMRFQGEMLWIEVEHPAWIQELNMLRTQLLSRIREEFPEAKIQKLHFILKK